MRRLVANNAEMLANLDSGYQHLYELARNTLGVDMSKMSPQEQQMTVQKLKEMGTNIDDVGDTVENSAKQMEHNIQTMQDASHGNVMNTPKGAARILFSIKEAQFMPPSPPIPTAPAEMGQEQQGDPDDLSGLKFSSGADVKNWLDQLGDPNQAIRVLAENFTNKNEMVTDENSQITSDGLGVIKDCVNDFYSSNDEQLKLQAASTLFDTIFPDGVKNNVTPDSDDVPASFERGVDLNVASIVENTNQLIKKLAEQHAAAEKTASNGFNLKKEAQHQGVHNVIYYGPSQTGIDAFTGNMISNWHLVERNKGFGLKIDDILDIDFEAIWRGTIMDKYSRPYRNKEGDWVGGYIENRFEVDKNIPVLNNMQLKPGQLRKPFVPEYSHTEARLEAKRTELNKDRGYGETSEDGKVFNWAKEASDNKKKVTAQSSISAPQMSPKAPKDPFAMPGDKPANTQQLEMCPTCNATVAPGSSTCKACGATIAKPLTADPRLAPVQRGMPGQPTQQQQGVAVQPGARLGSGAFDIKTASSDLWSLVEKLLPDNENRVGKHLENAIKYAGEKLAQQNGWLKRQINLAVDAVTKEHEEDLKKLSAAEASEKYSGIFFDGNKFICYSQRKPVRFDTHDQAEKFQSSKKLIQKKKNPHVILQHERDDRAEEFQQMKSSPQMNPGTLVPNQQLPLKPIPPTRRELEMRDIADKLGIDG